MDKITLLGEKRTLTGRKVKKLRSSGILPANVFGKKMKSLAVQVTAKDFGEIFAKAGETGVVTLNIKNGGKKAEQSSVLISNVQKDPVSDLPIHIDFRQIDLKEKIEASVPVEMIGESPAEKTGIGTVVQYLKEILVEALPGDLPEKFEIDASGFLEVDQGTMVKDLKYDKKKISIKDELEKIIAKVEPPQKEEEIAPAPPAEATVEAAEGEAVPGEETVPSKETEASPVD